MRHLFASCLLALAVVSASWAQQNSDPQQLLKQINEYRNELYKEVRNSKVQADYNAVVAKVKAKAEELLKGVDLANVDPKSALDWARVVEVTDNHKMVCDLAQKFLTTGPADKQKFEAMLLMSNSCNALGEADMLMMTLDQIPVPDFNSSTQLAYPTVGQYIDTIYEKKGLSAALASLETVSKKMVFEDPKAYAKRVLEMEKNRAANAAATIKDPAAKPAKTDEERMKELEKQGSAAAEGQVFMFSEKKAELYKEAGKKDMAVDTLKAAIAKMAPDSPNARRAKSALLQMTMTGAPAPAIVSERSYGEYKGLESLKGKVVIVDFFAHWCGPCIASFPDMEKLYADYHDKGLEVIGVTTYYGFYQAENSQGRDMPKDTEYGKMAEFIKTHKIPWPVVFGERSNMESYGVTGIPTAVVIDKDGNVHELHVGYSKESFAAFRKEIEELLKTK